MQDLKVSSLITCSGVRCGYCKYSRRRFESNHTFAIHLALIHKLDSKTIKKILEDSK